MADRPVLGNRRFVLEDHSRFSAKSADLIGTASDVQDLITLNDAGTWISRKWAATDQIVDLEGEDTPVCVESHFRLHPMMPSMDIGHEGFDPVGPPADWSA